jgi:LysM repeat protein
MRASAPVLLIVALTPLLCHCGGGSSISSAGSTNPGYGPFDRDGNYIEEWADKPAKKHWWGRETKPTPVPSEPAVASNTRTSSRSPGATEVASLERPASTRGSSPSSSRPPAPTPKPPTVASTSTPPPRPRPEPVKPPTPAPRRHTVVKGDTLYNLSRRYGTSISAIQKANGISGTTIRLGQTLLIPR